VASHQAERTAPLEALEDATGVQVIRQPSHRNRGQEKSRVESKRQVLVGNVHILSRSEGHTAKDRAIREKQEQRFLGDLTKLHARVRTVRLHDGRQGARSDPAPEGAPPPARGAFYALTYDAAAPTVTWAPHDDDRTKAAQLDGGICSRAIGRMWFCPDDLLSETGHG